MRFFLIMLFISFFSYANSKSIEIKYFMNEPSFLRSYGNLLLKKSKYKQALYYFKKLLKLENDKFRVMYKIAKIMFYLKRYPESLNYLNLAVSIKPFYRKALVLRGLVNIKLLKLNSAESDFQSALFLNQSDTFVLTKIASLYFKKKLYTKVIAYSKRAMCIKPGYWSCYYAGLAYYRIKHFYTAKYYLNRALSYIKNKDTNNLQKIIASCLYQIAVKLKFSGKYKAASNIFGILTRWYRFSVYSKFAQKQLRALKQYKNKFKQ